MYCSEHNPGARELAEELNGIWPRLLQVADVESWADLSSCDHMLVYLTAQTWTTDPEPFAAEIREAQRVGLHLQPCHEFPSVLDPGSARHALEFKQIMDMTPADLRTWPTNIYSQIAIALKGGELRKPGLANLASRLAVRVDRTSYSPDRLVWSKGVKPPTSSQPRNKLRALAHVFSFAAQPVVLCGCSSADVKVGASHPGEGSPRRGMHQTSSSTSSPHASSLPAVAAESSV